MIDTETGLAALRRVVKTAESNRVSWALIGGIAMHLYGSPRLTNYVDVIEWLIILKYIASRFRDQQDAVYLLKVKGLVDRRLLRRKIIATAAENTGL